MKKYRKLNLISILFIVVIYLLITRFTCLVKFITGFPCPSCGITRAYKCVLNLNFSGAWNYNPLYWFIPPVILFIIISDKPLFHSTKKQIIFLIVIFTIIFSVYIYRMITLFPDIPPMDYNKDSLLYTLYMKIKSVLQIL